jgi:hypothetical protein
VLAVVPEEDDGALAADVDDGAVSELDGILHRPVKLREHFAVARHMVHRARVEVLALKTVVGVGSCAEECLHLGLVQVDLLLLHQSRSDCQRRRRCVLDLLHHSHQERRFLILLGLGQIRALLWLAAISCPMTGGATVVTLVVMLRALLPTIAALVRASPLLAVTGRALPSVIALAGLLLPLLLREEQLAVYARRWQHILLLDAILCRA